MRALCDSRNLVMAFSDQEKAALFEVKGVGPTVVKRFEEIGIDSFSELASSWTLQAHARE